MIRLLVHCACVTPAVLLALGWQNTHLGVDPEKTLIWETGIWTFNLLIVVLVLPHAAAWARWPQLYRYRRAVGLWTFSYASTHFLLFITFLLGWDLGRLAEEIRERPYVLVGFSAWLILLPMAATSTGGWMRRLGNKWRMLHTLVYAAVTLAAIHFLMMVRSDYSWAVSYACIALILILARFIRFGKRQASSSGSSPQSSNEAH